VSLARRRLMWLGIAAAIILCGLAWRRPELGLPWTVAKYGGSVLWGAMVFFCVAAVLPRLALKWVAVFAAVIAALVEFSQLLSYPPLDSFRATTAGALLLGRTFDRLDILAYWGGVAVALCGARLLSRRFR
jgi:hypothetical protein